MAGVTPVGPFGSVQVVPERPEENTTLSPQPICWRIYFISITYIKPPSPYLFHEIHQINHRHFLQP